MARILHLGWSFSPHVSRWLRAQKSAGHDLHLVSYGGEELADVPTHIIPRGPIGKLGYLTAVGQVRKIAEQINPDLVHAHYAAGFGFWGASLKRHPLIISCWGTDIVGSARSFLMRRMVSRSLESADRVIVTSEFLRKSLANFPAKLKAEPDLIRFGMDLKQTETLYQRKVTESEPDRPLRLLFFKHHRPEYGPQIALDALAKAKQAGANVRLTLAGRGPETEKLTAQATALGLGDFVTFPGYIETEKALEFIAEHDVMLMPTIVPESFGVAALEAASLGLPVIASDIGGVSEIVRHQESGLLVPAGDSTALSLAILKLSRDETLRNEYSRQARELVVREFNWDKQVELMETLYREVL